VIEAAIAVHRELGPGLLETVYEAALARELAERGLKLVRQAPAHKKQVQTYLKLTGCKLGYLLNFGGDVMRTRITRCVNGLEEQPLRLCASAGEEPGVPTTG
jgi:nucleoid-associated protein YejK